VYSFKPIFKRFSFLDEIFCKFFFKILVILKIIGFYEIRGGSLKKIAKKIIPNVPINKKVYTKASIKRWFIYFFND
jgi:hypothetical protein